MLLTYSSDVIGLVTLTVIGTVLPFSTSGGMSSLTFPVFTMAAPTTSRIAVASIAGVASTGGTVITMSAAMPPARPRNWRRVASGSCIGSSLLTLFTQRHQIGHDILDLFRRQDRSAAPIGADAIKSFHPVEGWHHCRRVDARSIHQPESQLAFGPAPADAGEAGRQITLKLLLGKWAAMAEDASAAAIDHHRPAARGVACST